MEIRCDCGDCRKLYERADRLTNQAREMTAMAENVRDDHTKKRRDGIPLTGDYWVVRLMINSATPSEPKIAEFDGQYWYFTGNDRAWDAADVQLICRIDMATQEKF